MVVFTGVANPQSILNASSNATNLGNQTHNLTLTLSNSGSIQSFFCQLSLHDFNAVIGTAVVSIRRNGQVLYQTQINLAEAANVGDSIFVYETLSFLVGAQCYAGEEFQFRIVGTVSGGSVNFSAQINMVTLNVPRMADS